MKFCDFRLRPPFGDFLNTSQYNLERNKIITAKFGMYQAESAAKKSMDLFVKEMDEANIQMGVMSGRFSEVFGNVSTNTMKSVMEMLPRRMTGFVGVDPLDAQAAFKLIDDEVLNGPFAGLNIEPLTAHKIPMCADDRRIYPIYERAQEAGIPILLMTGGIPNVPVEYSYPKHLEVVARDFPKLTIVSPHGCWPHTLEIIRTCLLCENIYLSPDIYTMNLPGSDDYMKAATTFLQDRFIYGSAHPTMPMVGCVRYWESLNIKDDILEKLVWSNAMRVLNQKNN